MEFRHLRYFLAVVDEGRFGIAARRLQITQPPLSRAIQQLERELRVLLFERTRNRAIPTAAGRALEGHARQILKDVESSADFIQREHRPGGKLSVGYVHTANLRLLPRLLKAFCRLHPDTEIRLNPLQVEAQIQALRESRIDLGILRLPVAAAGIKVESLLDEAPVVALPRSHPLSRAVRVRPGALSSTPVFSLDGEPGPRTQVVLRVAGSRKRICPNLRLETGDVYDHLGLIAAGVGVAYLPESVIDVHRKGVIYRRVHPPAPPFRLGIAYRAGRRSREETAFLSVARRLFVAG